MDLAYWGFGHWPFQRTFLAARFFASSLHEEALARLLYLVEEDRRSGIVMGPAGTGKTFLLRLLQQRAERMGRLTVRCDATGLEGRELASQIAMACHVACDPDASVARIWNGLQQRFMALSIIQQPLVVIIDHFDSVHSDCLNTISRLNQLADATGVTMSLVLGTREQRLTSELNELVELKIEIGPWSVEECSNFIRTAVMQAGSAKDLFNDEAMSLIHLLTGGVPVSVVRLCHLSLLAAMESEDHSVTPEIVDGLFREISNRDDGEQSRFKSSSKVSPKLIR